MVIMSREGLDELIAEGRMAAQSDVNLAQTPIGLAIRKGMPKPDISTVEAFKKTLLGAESITFPTSTTGIYLVEKLIPRLGLSEKLAAKLRPTDVAPPDPKMALAIQPVSEIIHAAGFDFVGPIPAELQYISVFSAAVLKDAKEPEAARKLIAFLSSEKALRVVQKNGMDRAKTQ